MRTRLCADSAYLQSVIFHILISLNNSTSYAAIAARLNGLSLSSPTGREWNFNLIKNLLKKIRNPLKYHSVFREELDQLINSGAISPQFAHPLLRTDR